MIQSSGRFAFARTLATLECAKARDFVNARKFLYLSLKGQPAWLEPYCAGYGLTGDELLRKLTQRLRLYRFPMLFRLWFPLERLMAEVRWRRLDATVQMRSHLRLERGEAVGFLSASPNPDPSSAGNAGLSSVALEWTSAATRAVEVRLGRPDGPLISHTGGSGKTKTDQWVGDGTIFYLQNVFDGLPLTLENTLALFGSRSRNGHDDGDEAESQRLGDDVQPRMLHQGRLGRCTRAGDDVPIRGRHR